MPLNALNMIDFYKADHRRQYPEGTTLVVSNFTPRSGKHANVPAKDQICFFGMQHFVQDFLVRIFDSGFFKLPKEQAVGAYRRRMDNALGKGAITMEHIEALHDLGYLPLEIRSLPEGSKVPVNVPCMTVRNTLPEFFWLTNYIETILSTYLWLPSTSATTAWNYRQLLDKYVAKTGSPAGFVDFQAHDFSFRGMSSLQSAMMSGGAHMLFFRGTDTVAAIDWLETFYDADSDKELIGCSVPATEHSVMCMGGEMDELKTFHRLITDLYPSGIVSIVSDTWDFWQVLTEYAAALKPAIMSRAGKVVFRPDSGDPVKIICGDPEVMVGYPENKGAVEVLWDTFGGTITETGHKLLDEHVGLIYGDSITYERAEQILSQLEAKGFASANVVFGIGSFTYQMNTRDTWGWAVKATYGIVNGEERNIYKCPKTDDGIKKSAKGLVRVVQKDNGLVLEQGVTMSEFEDARNEMRVVFKDGQQFNRVTLEEIRRRVTV